MTYQFTVTFIGTNGETVHDQAIYAYGDSLRKAARVALKQIVEQNQPRLRKGKWTHAVLRHHSQRYTIYPA